MPGMGISDNDRPSALNEHHRLKAHRALPRKRDVVPDFSLPTIQVANADQVGTTPNHIVYSGAPNLPLTPPSLSKESEGGTLHNPHQVKDDYLDEETERTTPTRQLDPLTPDVTPPRVVNLLRKREGQDQIHPSGSSGAESFQTAREGPPSDEEAERRDGARAPSLRPRKQRAPHPLQNSALSDDDGASSSRYGSSQSTIRAPQLEKGDGHHFHSFDGQWIGKQESSPLSRKHEDQNGYSSSKKGMPTEDRVDRGPPEQTRSSQHSNQSVDLQKFAAEIAWPDSNGHADRASKTQSSRMSGASVTSTIEAIVIDSPPQKRRTLRHTSKNASLRSISSPMPRTAPQQNRDSCSTVESQPRLSHKPVRLTNEDRRSVSSDMSLTTSLASSRRKPKEEVIPVVVIPQRRSSLRSSAPASRDHSRSRSMGSARRPTTAPNRATGTSDETRHRRTTSESLPPTSRTSRDRSRRTNSLTTRPEIPVRRSSLSAPTSRNNSRAASMTSNHNNNNADPQPPVHVTAPNEKPERYHDTRNLPSVANTTVNRPEAPKPSTTRAVNQAPPIAHRPAVDEVPKTQSPLVPPLTPFQPSIQSLSPGPVEISEARAVPFFAHNNESILVVERYPQTQSQIAAGPAIIPPQLIDNPQTPVAGAPAPAAAAADVDSPLRNPRPPPKPPVPTSEGQDDNHAPPNGSATVGRRFGSLRRALSSRRNSDTLSSQVDTRSVRNRKEGKDIDSKQWPFWRPQAFWDDVKESDPDENGNSRTLTLGSEKQQRGTDTYIGNSLGIPQSRAVFEGPLTLIRRVSDKARSRKPRLANLNHVNASLSALPRHSRRRRRYHRAYNVLTVADYLSYLSPKENYRRASKAWRNREANRLEARRQRLRQKIGARVPIDDWNDPIMTTSGYTRRWNS